MEGAAGVLEGELVEEPEDEEPEDEPDEEPEDEPDEEVDAAAGVDAAPPSLTGVAPVDAAFDSRESVR